jgi:hypothetical protein
MDPGEFPRAKIDCDVVSKNEWPDLVRLDVDERPASPAAAASLATAVDERSLAMESVLVDERGET